MNGSCDISDFIDITRIFGEMRENEKEYTVGRMIDRISDKENRDFQNISGYKDIFPLIKLFVAGIKNYSRSRRTIEGGIVESIGNPTTTEEIVRRETEIERLKKDLRRAEEREQDALDRLSVRSEIIRGIYDVSIDSTEYKNIILEEILSVYNGYSKVNDKMIDILRNVMREKKSKDTEIEELEQDIQIREVSYLLLVDILKYKNDQLMNILSESDRFSMSDISILERERDRIEKTEKIIESRKDKTEGANPTGTDGCKDIYNIKNAFDSLIRSIKERRNTF